MRRSYIASSLTLATALGLGLAQPAAAEDALVSAIPGTEDVVSSFNEAYNQRNLDAFLATFAEDAVVVWDGVEMIGHEAIADGYSLDFANATPQSRITRRGRAGRGAIVLEEALVFSDGSEQCCTASIVTVQDGRISRLVIQRMPSEHLARR